MFKKILIANRGEVALRIARTCREMGIACVAVCSSADQGSAVTEVADETVHVGPAPAMRSYLSIPAIIEAARKTGADAIHPGYGFLSEDPDFAEVCEQEGIGFVGPPPHVLEQMGDKSLARMQMLEAGLALLPGSDEVCQDESDCRRTAEEIGFPAIIKAVAGGGGRGMTVVRNADDLASAFAETRAAAQALYGDNRVYVERYLEGARHVEVQVLCDRYGGAVHLGERDCSVQRRHQKLVEETPAPGLSERTRTAMAEAAIGGALAAGVVGAATVEFLLGPDGRFYFMEVNARLQVEHPVTEMVTGLDIVEHQLRIAAGEPLAVRQGDVRPRGTAIECRINAEDPRRDFLPTPGTVEVFRPPGGPFTRVDTHGFAGFTVSPDYDPLLAKVVTWGADRDAALRRMTRALVETRIGGPGLSHNVALLLDVLANPEFAAGRPATDLLPAMLRAVTR